MGMKICVEFDFNGMTFDRIMLRQILRGYQMPFRVFFPDCIRNFIHDFIITYLSNFNLSFLSKVICQLITVFAAFLGWYTQ